MDLFAIIFLSVVSFLIGIVVTLVLQYYILYSFFKQSPTVKPPEKGIWNTYILPDAIKKHLETDDLKNTNSSLPISLIMQFLFHELRHSESIKRWLYKKLSLEFEELLTKTTIGKFFDSITIKDMNLGSQFPVIKEIYVEDVKLNKKEGHIDTVNICLNLDYTGNFLLSIDGKMKFGRTAYLSIKVKKLSGLARLQFTRFPYTHWSFSFYNEPIIELAVESHFQGRQLQSNVTNLIVNQIKKAIKRKHTLPNYKIRYKPFFVKTDPSQLDLEDNEILPQGQLEVSCIEVTRLEIPNNVQNVYCNLCIDSIPWISIYQRDDKIFMILEITITKLRQNQLGVIFKQEQNTVIVDSVATHSSASKSGLKPGDNVLAVENKLVNTVPQIAKLIKAISTVNFTLRIERIVDNYMFKTKYKDNINIEQKIVNSSNNIDIISDLEQDNYINAVDKNIDLKKSTSKLTDRFNRTNERLPIKISNENMSKIAQTIGNFSLRKRKLSTSSISVTTTNTSTSSTATTTTTITATATTLGDTNKNSPISSCPSTPQHVSSIRTGPMLTPKKHSISELPEIYTELNGSDNNIIEIIKSKELNGCLTVLFNEDFQFNLKDGQKYLNINVWGTILDDKDLLLGFLNIPLSHILNECCNSVLGHYMRSYSFLPPSTQITNTSHPLITHSGFEQVFCYGDILLSFMWSHDDDILLKRKLSSVNLDLEIKSSDLLCTSSKHDFIRTQFHRTTHCDFCTKKIWFKDAVQCRDCGICCHRKCQTKCQCSTGCISRKINDQLTNDLSSQPEIIMTEAPDDLTLNHINTIKLNSNDHLKRVNSVNSLSIPGSHLTTNLSKSLPPSPQRTPSRKQSLINLNPFILCPEILEDIQSDNIDASDSVQRLLDQIMQCSSDETLMDAAKESGKQLYATMPHDEKVEKINRMMAELKKTLDNVTIEHMELTKQMSLEDSETEKTKLAFLMGQADAKVHGLSVLMLHYCSSLQQTQEKIV